MISLLRTAKELLNTKKTLNPKIFDANAHMHHDVREKIMKVANLLIKQKIECLFGFKVADIVVVGSSGGYMYSDSSDIDVKIFIETTNPTIKSLNNFAKYCCYQEHKDKTFLSVNGLMLDFSFGPVRYDSGGNYSVLNDCWGSPPRKDNLAARFTPGEIVQGYYELCAKIYQVISEYDFQKGILTGKNITTFDLLRRSLFSAKYDLENNYEDNIKKFLIYRLFVKKGMLGSMYAFLKQVENDFYTNKKIADAQKSLNPKQEP